MAWYLGIIVSGAGLFHYSVLAHFLTPCDLPAHVYSVFDFKLHLFVVIYLLVLLVWTAMGDYLRPLNTACSDSELERHQVKRLSSSLGNLTEALRKNSSDQESLISSTGIFVPMQNMKHNVTEKVAQVSLWLLLPLTCPLCKSTCSYTMVHAHSAAYCLQLSMVDMARLTIPSLFCQHLDTRCRCHLTVVSFIVALLYLHHDITLLTSLLNC